MEPGGSGSSDRRVLRVAVAAVSITQIAGWGTTFYLPAVLASAMAGGIGLPVQFVFGGVTLMLLVGAVCAPAAGRVMARRGARPCMIVGSLVISLGLLVLSGATGAWSFAAGWALLGLATPIALGQAASTAMVEIAPERARSAVTVMLLFSGLSSTACWPLLIWLDGLIGWRSSLVVYATFHALVAAPLHAWCLPRRRPPRADPPAGAASPLSIVEEVPRPVRGTFTLTALTFSLTGLITWGIPLHIISVLRDLGHTETAAVTMGALLGPGQVLARGLELAGGHRLPILSVGAAAVGLLIVALLILLSFGGSTAAAICFALGYGISAGSLSIVRAIAPLRIFGRSAYATVIGRLAFPQNIAFGAAPVLFASVRESFGARALVLLALTISCAALGSNLLLAARLRNSRAQEEPDVAA